MPPNSLWGCLCIEYKSCLNRGRGATLMVEGSGSCLFSVGAIVFVSAQHGESRIRAKVPSTLSIIRIPHSNNYQNTYFRCFVFCCKTHTNQTFPRLESSVSVGFGSAGKRGWNCGVWGSFFENRDFSFLGIWYFRISGGSVGHTVDFVN